MSQAEKSARGPRSARRPGGPPARRPGGPPARHPGEPPAAGRGRVGAGLDRRELMRAGAGLAGLGLSGAGLAPVGSAAAAAWTRARKTRRVVLVALAGGVRTRETFGTPANVPNLRAMADEGVLYTRVRSSNLGHFGAALSMFTGVSEARGIRENARGPDPTLFEYVRKAAGLGAGEVWISTSGGAQQTNYSYSLHRDFGPTFGANTLDGDGVFNKELAGILDELGRPRELEQRERELLDRMRGAIGAREGGERAALNSAESAARIERYILAELGGDTSDLRGSNAADAKALRVARNLLAVFKPRLVSVVLQQADVAHGSFNEYVEVVRQNDAAIGELWRTVQEDDELRETTAFIVCPEFGRDSDLNARRGLDHGDDSDDLNYVSAVCQGPDFGRGRVVKDDVRVIDLCPTVCELFGAEAPVARGKRLPKLYA